MDFSQWIGFCPELLYFLKNLIWLLKLPINSWFNLPLTQISIFIPLSSWVLFEGMFSQWVLYYTNIFTCINTTKYIKSKCFLLKIGDHNDFFFSNILLENIDINIPLSVLTPCIKLPNPNKKQTPPISLKWKVILIKNTTK